MRDKQIFTYIYNIKTINIYTVRSDINARYLLMRKMRGVLNRINKYRIKMYIIIVDQSQTTHTRK
jgi:hypothetical protein